MITQEELDNYFSLEEKIINHLKDVSKYLHGVNNNNFNDFEIDDVIYVFYDDYDNCDGYVTVSYKFEKEYMFMSLDEIIILEQEKAKEKAEIERLKKEKELAEKKKQQLIKEKKQRDKDLEELKRLKEKYEK